MMGIGGNCRCSLGSQGNSLRVTDKNLFSGEKRNNKSGKGATEAPLLRTSIFLLQGSDKGGSLAEFERPLRERSISEKKKKNRRARHTRLGGTDLLKRDKTLLPSSKEKIGGGRGGSNRGHRLGKKKKEVRYIIARGALLKAVREWN